MSPVEKFTDFLHRRIVQIKNKSLIILARGSQPLGDLSGSIVDDMTSSIHNQLTSLVVEQSMYLNGIGGYQLSRSIIDHMMVTAHVGKGLWRSVG